MNRTNYPINLGLAPFEIDHIDPMGQGVSKITDEILFVRKTLPGEKGVARILKRAKGVAFGEIHELTTRSPERADPSCPHFQDCQGCHFLHTEYDEEIKSKLATFHRGLAHQLPHFKQNIKIHQASKRLGYRTRIQLHFDHKNDVIGFVDAWKKQIIPVPQCQVAEPVIQEKLQELYLGRSWRKLVKGKGHLELSTTAEGEIHLAINRPYSAGGFRQVFPEMNDVLLEIINQTLGHYPDYYGPNKVLLDLFGGDGNLSRSLTQGRSYVVDSFVPREKQQGHQEFHKIDLYSDYALPLFKQVLGERPLPVLILDPPRSGLKNLSQWVETLEPELIIYVSCHHATQLRDVTPLQESYEILEAHLLDFFPSTFHFETVLILKRRKS